ncbi:MAG: hypothetical protein HF314_02885 [Ignavibacteria bacterium]|jgi:hypothetical protein|nr:hypothetical protein [Ignavibacteria bacterium]MCU7501994.1 hypothetical protein [Ignavibacteria bacterium]MCU7516962.1 hypothetical protein [Ignavibacteria bacterium]
MKLKYVTVLLISALNFIPTSNILPWGDKGHKLTTSKAFECLPNELSFMFRWKKDIVEHSIDPDHRKKGDNSEASKHFIDIDYYQEFLNGSFTLNKDSLKNKYGEKVFLEQGILPWATENTLEDLTKAFRQMDTAAIKLYASDLAHYVADGFQPQHATVNYNGKLTGQKGIHFRYEIDMLDSNLAQIEKEVRPEGAFYVANPEGYIFSYIEGSDIFAETILSADKAAYKASGEKYDGKYYKLLWFRTKYLTIQQIDSAARALASLYYTAWFNAGKPVAQSN